jgi:uncharacterized coiled-coil protein SlyX
LSLYRQARGLPEDSVIFQETTRKEQEQFRATLAQQLDAKETQIGRLKNQIASLNKKLNGMPKATSASSRSDARTLKPVSIYWPKWNSYNSSLPAFSSLSRKCKPN